mmetsp:Transcript_15566/g.43552  ORF Transcript_15566/g.43552 Transcript_15566/m.43552 type:complete len:422 (-) Transcript_15566:440-1705(-)
MLLNLSTMASPRPAFTPARAASLLCYSFILAATCLPKFGLGGSNWLIQKTKPWENGQERVVHEFGWENEYSGPPRAFPEQYSALINGTAQLTILSKSDSEENNKGGDNKDGGEDTKKPDVKDYNVDVYDMKRGSSSESASSSAGSVLCTEEYGQCDDSVASNSIPRGYCSTNERWLEIFQENAERVKAAGCDLEVMWYGDSIINYWHQKSKAIEVWKGHVESSGLKASWAGIPGDESRNLMCRINHGEYQYIHPKVVIISIGINDVFYGDDAEVENEDFIDRMSREAGRNVQGIISYIRRQNCDAHIVITSVLTGSLDREDYSWPNSLTKAIAAVNAEYNKLGTRYRNVHYLYCQDRFLEPVDAEGSQSDGHSSSSTNSQVPYRISDTLMGDTVHPTSDGYKVLADCVMEYVVPIAYNYYQ